jgi:uncharacterized protein (TIGR04255 family)
VAAVILEAQAAPAGVVSDEAWRSFESVIAPVIPELKRLPSADKDARRRHSITSEDGTLHGHVTDARLFVRQARPYPLWENLSPTLTLLLGAFWSLVGAHRTGCTLEYQNHIRLGHSYLVEPRDFFNIYPGTSGDLDADYVAFMAGILLPAPDNQSLTRVEVTSSADDEDPEGFFVDLHISFTTPEHGLGDQRPDNWLEMAHDEVERQFLASVTERTLQQMKGE